jgi:hypothetical protein
MWSIVFARRPGRTKRIRNPLLSQERGRVSQRVLWRTPESVVGINPGVSRLTLTICRAGEDDSIQQSTGSGLANMACNLLPSAQLNGAPPQFMLILTGALRRTNRRDFVLEPEESLLRSLTGDERIAVLNQELRTIPVPRGDLGKASGKRVSSSVPRGAECSSTADTTCRPTSSLKRRMSPRSFFVVASALLRASSSGDAKPSSSAVDMTFPIPVTTAVNRAGKCVSIHWSSWG